LNVKSHPVKLFANQGKLCSGSFDLTISYRAKANQLKCMHLKNNIALKKNSPTVKKYTSVKGKPSKSPSSSQNKKIVSLGIQIISLGGF